MSIPLPTSTVATIGANVTALIGDFSIVITFIIGMLVAFFVIQFVVDIIRGDKRS